MCHRNPTLCKKRKGWATRPARRQSSTQPSLFAKLRVPSRGVRLFSSMSAADLGRSFGHEKATSPATPAASRSPKELQIGREWCIAEYRKSRIYIRLAETPQPFAEDFPLKVLMHAIPKMLSMTRNNAEKSRLRRVGMANGR